MPLILRINCKRPGKGAALAASLLREGKIIAYPTETSYGIGANALDEKAVKRVHEVKGQGFGKPISVIVPSLDAAKKIGKIGKDAEKLVNEFMPGPLTLVVDKKENVPDALSEGGIAFRISSNPVANGIARIFKGAITATSANLTGEEPIFSGEEAAEKLGGKVDLIVDCGSLEKKEASTIFDMRTGKVLREGPVKGKEIMRVLGE